MFPRNLSLYRFAPAFGSALADTAALAATLAEHAAKPVGPLEMSTRGFVPPFGEAADALVQPMGKTLWITLGGEDKILPGAAVNAETRKKAAQIEAEEGRRLSGEARRRLKEEVLAELLPRALSRPVRVDAFVLVDLGVVAISTASRRAAEGVLSELRQALGSFPALPVNAEVAPRAVLTGMLAGDTLPDGFALGESAVLADPVDRGALVRLQRQELQAEEVHTHLDAGKQAARLGVVLDDRIAFTLCDDLVVRQFAMLDGALESLENSDRDSAAAELDARYALFDGELRRLWRELESLFVLSKVEG